MISLTFDLVTGIAKLTQAATLKVGADVPVRLTFSAAPGEVTTLQLALGTNEAAPTLLAFTDVFAQVDDQTWEATLDANDTRLATYMTGKSATAVNAELVAIIDGLRQVTPNLSATVQPAIISGDPTSESGPTYLTQAQSDAKYAVRAWQVKAGIYTAAVGDRIQADTSAGIWTLTLPPAPAVGDAVEIEDATASFSTHNLTVARNGQKLNNGTSNFTASTAGGKLRAVFISSGYGWSVK